MLDRQILVKFRDGCKEEMTASQMPLDLILFIVNHPGTIKTPCVLDRLQIELVIRQLDLGN